MKTLLLALLFIPTVCLAQMVDSPPLNIPVSYPVNTTASQEMVRFTTPTGTHNGVTHHPFQFYQRTTVFGNDRTDSVGWGFTPSGDVQGAPSLAFIMEDSFGTPPNTQFELHLQLAPLEAPISRPWTWTFDRRTGRTVVVTSGVSHFYGGGWLVGGKPELHIGEVETLSMGPFRQQSNSVIFETLSTGGAPAKQIRIMPHATDPATTRLVFGDSNGIGLANVNNELEIKRAGVFATISAGPYEVNGTKVLGSQCGAIPNSNGTQSDNTRAINAMLSCMRQHGTIAP